MLKREDRAGLYFTVIVHLVILIILLLAQIGFSLKKGETFVIDFSRQEELKRQEEVKTFEEDIDKRVEDLLAGRVSSLVNGSSGIEFRNVTSSRNKGALKDDRNTDADKLYSDAARLAKDLKNGPEISQNDDDYVETPSKAEEDKPQQKNFSGPSVLSWHLDGRKASHLPIPAYRCYGGGMVTVIISVNNSGKVIDARIQDEVSSDDRCLREFAIRAARLSRFSASPKAPAKQTGDIVYQFIAQ